MVRGGKLALGPAFMPGERGSVFFLSPPLPLKAAGEGKVNGCTEAF